MAQNSQADEKWKMSDTVAEVAILIVGFRNSADIIECLRALSCAPNAPTFDVFICENGGVSFYRDLIQKLTGEKGPCISMEVCAASNLLETRFSEALRLRFRSRPSNVWVGCAKENLGYAGGINAWIRPLVLCGAWKGLWILNPDTLPDAHALAALVERAEFGGKGMVGSTILDDEGSDRVRFRGGLHWQRLTTRGISIGLNQRLYAPHNLSDIEAAMDSPSGASMYVTRSCIEKIGLMDERYFLFFEDLDWGVRAKSLGLGYASASIVAHKRGTATGSARNLAAMPKLSVYLQQRNGIHFVRRHFPWSLPLRILISYLYAVRFLLSGAIMNFIVAMKGIAAGLRGEVGRPSWHRDAP
jgi:N-acetylglucosaminyl-diphospho-decaprenol L-rhamnosyltransferase